MFQLIIDYNYFRQLTFVTNYYLIKETQNDKKLSRKEDCLAIKGRSHAIIKNANIQKVINNMEPFFIK